MQEGVERSQKVGFEGEQSVHDLVLHRLGKMVRVDFFEQTLEMEIP